jgi:hypothetical protein
VAAVQGRSGRTQARPNPTGMTTHALDTFLMWSTRLTTVVPVIIAVVASLDENAVNIILVMLFIYFTYLYITTNKLLTNLYMLHVFKIVYCRFFSIRPMGDMFHHNHNDKANK